MSKKHYYFIGIGGIGMGALAKLLLAKGHSVSGSDLRKNAMTRELEKKGAHVFFGHDALHLGEADYVIFSSAVKADNCELCSAREKGIPILKRSELLAELMEGQIGITVAGAHGKTTTTSMVSHVLEEAGMEPTTIIGGIVPKTLSNASLGNGKYFVAELDESDGSFLYFKPKFSIITNIDFEHVDYYQSWPKILKAYKNFMEKTDPEGLLICCADDQKFSELLRGYSGEILTYGFSESCDLRAVAMQTQDFSSTFCCVFKGQNLGEIFLPVPGQHNILNALGCICLGLNLGINFDIMKKALGTYQSVRRRFQLLADRHDIKVVDDYAHHPTEILNTLNAARSMGKRRLVTVFQPHRYSRVKFLMDDFSRSLANMDYLILTEIYAASEKPLEGASVEILIDKIKKVRDIPVVSVEKQKLIDFLLPMVQPGDLVLFLGAGDITEFAHAFAEKITNAGVFNEQGC